MATVSYRISARDIRKAIKEKVDGPIIALTKNPDIMRLLAEKAIEIVTPYVPMKDENLRRSTHVVYKGRQVYIVWGSPSIVEKYVTRTGNIRTVSTADYAAYQHDADDSGWNRTTPGTKSYWTEELYPGTPGFQELVDFAIPLVKKEVKRGGK